MTTITSAGIGSGLDLEGIIEAYIDAEAIPSEIRLQNKQDRLETELSGVGQLKLALESFENAVNNLSDADDFNKQITSSTSDSISLSTNGFASNGSFQVEVNQLAQASKLQSQSFTDSSDTVGSGTLTFGAGAESFDVTIDASDTLSDIRDKINESGDNFGVVVNVVNTDAGSYLTYATETTGADNALTVSTSDAALDNISTNNTTTQTAQDAIVLIDGNTVTSDTNSFQNVVEDVTFTVSEVNTGSPATISISQDEDNGRQLIEDFVQAYNTLVGTMDYLSDPENGDLAFDSSIRSLDSQLTSIVTSAVSGLSGSLTSLSDIGVTLDSSGGLEINPVGIGTLPSGSESLTDALENNLNEVGEIFASDDGIATQLLTLLDSYVGTDGTVTERNSALSLEIAGIPAEYEELETRLRDYEDSLRQRFSFLDATVAQYNATSNWLTSALKLPSSDD